MISHTKGGEIKSRIQAGNTSYYKKESHEENYMKLAHELHYKTKNVQDPNETYCHIF